MQPAARPWLVFIALLAGSGLLAAFTLRLHSGHELARQGERLAGEIRQREAAHRQPSLPVPRYRPVGTIPTGLTQPRALTTGAEGTIYVAGNHEIRQLDEQGAVMAQLNLGADIHCLAVSPEGELYVGLRDRIEIWPAIMAPGGPAPRHPRARWTLPGRRVHLTSLALTSSALWAGDAGSRVVWQYDLTGQLKNRLGEGDPAQGRPALAVPSPHLAVVADQQGTIWLTNPGRRLVEHYTESGEWSGSFGQSSQSLEGFCGCCNPIALALLPDGRLVTAEKGLPRVKVYQPDGTLHRIVALPDDLSPTAAGLDLAVKPDGQVLILDPPAGVIRVFAE